jgi:hypothetical protein
VNVAETLLVYFGIPLAIVLVMAALIFIPGGKRRPRYRPGQPWEHEAIWYEPHPEQAPPAGHGDGHGAGHGAAALPSAERTAIAGSTPTLPARAGGPLGGARGTW